MRGLRGVLAAICVIAFVGCGKDSVLGVQTGTVTGSYVLRTIDGSDLPFTIQRIGADSTQVLNETLVLATGGIFSISGAARVTASGVTTTETYSLDGTYTVDTQDLILTFSDGGRESGTVSGGTVTLLSSGFTLVYRR